MGKTSSPNIEGNMKEIHVIFCVVLIGMFPLACQKTYTLSPLSPPAATPTPTATPHWQYVGNAGFSQSTADYTSLFVYNGAPYVAYSDNSVSGEPTVMTYNGSSWIRSVARGLQPIWPIISRFSYTTGRLMWPMAAIRLR